MVKRIETPGKISILVSVYNEEEVLPMFKKELMRVIAPLDYEAELIFINDGSSDNSRNILDSFAESDKNIRVIHFSRNFGHEAAMIAGIDHCSGDVAICLDADLQHPPDLIPGIVDRYMEGFDIVNAVRSSREDGGLLKRITSSIFYKFLNAISDYSIEPKASDFFLISKRIIELMKSSYRERTRFLRGFIQMVGFSKTTISYVAPARKAGKSKYNFIRLLLLSATAVASTSRAPLRVSMFLAILFGGGAFIVAVYSIVQKFLGTPFSGYTSLIVLISFGFCLLFFLLGIIGQYLGDIFIEIKNRPLYVIDEIND